MVQITNTRRHNYSFSFLHSCQRRFLMRVCVITMVMIIILPISVTVFSTWQVFTSSSNPAVVFRDESGIESVELETHKTNINRNNDVVVSPENLPVRTRNLDSTNMDDWCDASSQLETRTKSLWQALDSTTAKYHSNNTKVSGGLFLYPRQTNLIAKVMKDLISLHHEHYQSRPFQVCETGFGSGHSTAFFLSQSEDVQIVTFDKFDRPYQIPIVELLKQEFPDRIQHVAGNSCKTVPRHFEKSNQQYHRQELSSPSFQRCDLLHGSSLCKSDNIDLVQHASCGTILTSTAMHSITDKDVYFGPYAQWRKLRDDRCISDIVCFEEEEKRLEKSFFFAKKDEVMSHKFCFAVVTGFCRADTGSSIGVDGRMGGIESKSGDREKVLKQEKVENESTAFTHNASSDSHVHECEKEKLAAKDILNKLCLTLRIEVPA
mmetsp:Transcript_25353/g.25690  ORF Transcript_25353/g.25690 Transcript_25353/m.25690 type:complete len:433 (-) Transcript_25353:220-1518(-)